MLDNTTLAWGVYYTRLCTDCINEWNALFELTPTYNLILELRRMVQSTSIAMEHDGVDRSNDLIAMDRRMVELHPQIRSMADTWIKAGIG
jgi:hypothetical protein